MTQPEYSTTSREAMAEPPLPPPLVQPRASITARIIGLGIWGAILFGYSVPFVSKWLWIAAAIVAFFAGSSWLGNRLQAIRERFADARRSELATYYEARPDDLATRIMNDSELYVRQPVIPGWLVLCSLSLSLVVPFLLFRDVNTYLESWPWVVRWLLAAIAAAAGWFVMITNLGWSLGMPAGPLFDYDALRHEQRELLAIRTDHQNDIAIVREINDLETLNRRVDAYVLESTLLSALSFSSFMAIVLADGAIYRSSLSALLWPEFTWQDLPNSLGYFTIPESWTIPLPPSNYVIENLVALIALSLLLCAAAFIGVLVARMRFNDGYRDALGFLRAAERLNEKEENLFNDGDRISYSAAIDNQLAKAQILREGLAVATFQMQLSRRVGLFFFVSAVVLCGLLFNVMVTGILILAFLCAQLAGWADSFQRGVRRHEVYGRGGLGGLLFRSGR